MAPSLPSPLSTARVLLEACPPALDDRDKAYALLRQSFACYNSFHAVSVPDLQDHSEFNRTRERVPNHEFAAWIRQMTAKPLSMYKVCVHCTEPEFREWVEDAVKLGCGDVILVGADSSARAEAGRLALGEAAAIAQDEGLRTGGIIIPTRREHFRARPASRDESDRLLDKVRNQRFEFFTTQILYEGEWMGCLLLDLVRRMEPEELPKIFLTFSPFVCKEDLQFARRTLGVYVPPDVDRMLRGARSMREASISSLLLIWERLSTFAGEIGYPRDRLAVNVEYLDSRNPRNVDAAFELAEEFGRLLQERPRPVPRTGEAG
jgi:hypothetical protein